MTKIITSADEAATYLNMKKSYLYKLICLGKIPHSKPTGGKLYFDRDKLDAWMLGRPICAEVSLSELEEYEYRIRKDERSKVANEFEALHKRIKELEDKINSYLLSAAKIC